MVRRATSALAAAGLLGTGSANAADMHEVQDQGLKPEAAPSLAGKLKISTAAGIAQLSYGSSDYVGSDDVGSRTSFSANLGGYQSARLGYAVNANWLAGLYAQYSAWETDSRALNNQWFVGPEMSYVFDPVRSVQPFVGATVGLNGSSYEHGPSGEGYFAGLRTGTIVSIANEFSIDPTVALNYSFNRRTSGGGGELNSREHSVDLTGLVAFTAWL